MRKRRHLLEVRSSLVTSRGRGRSLRLYLLQALCALECRRRRRVIPACRNFQLFLRLFKFAFVIITEAEATSFLHTLFFCAAQRLFGPVSISITC